MMASIINKLLYFLRFIVLALLVLHIVTGAKWPDTHQWRWQ